MRAKVENMVCNKRSCQKVGEKGNILCCVFDVAYKLQVKPLFDNKAFLKLCESEPNLAWKSCDKELMSKCQTTLRENVGKAEKDGKDANDSGNLSSNGSFDAHQSKNYSIVVLVYLIALLGGFLALS